MHLDGDPHNCEEWNLVTACRSCHMAYDQPEIVAGRTHAQRWALIEAGQLELLPDIF